VVSTQSRGGVDTSAIFQKAVRTIQEWCRHSPGVVSTLVLFPSKQSEQFRRVVSTQSRGSVDTSAVSQQQSERKK
ncbi:hypothetical protein Taro_050778, partial [Colocasia esculenta]|nr:hypothetical protein [Colocasia esculenta]